MEQLKKLIEKWKADVFAYETKAKNFGYNYSMYVSFKVIASLLKSCISEAEQLLQETGEGMEEKINRIAADEMKYGNRAWE